MTITSYFSNGKNNIPVILVYEHDNETIHLNKETNECYYVKNNTQSRPCEPPANQEINTNDFELCFLNVYRLKTKFW